MRVILLILILAAATYGYFTQIDPEMELLKKIPIVQNMVPGNSVDAIMNQAIALNNKPSESFPLYLKAAEMGDAEAQHIVGSMYIFGDGTEQDPEAGIMWLHKAADQGFAASQNDLGAYYLQGGIVPQDDEEAVLWFRKAAEQGFVDSQHALAMMYFVGRDPQQDDQEAAQWIKRASENGLAKAQVILGLLYIGGRGLDRDYSQGADWLMQASEQEGVDASQYMRLARAAQQVNQILKRSDIDPVQAQTLRDRLDFEVDQFFQRLRTGQQQQTLTIEQLAQIAEGGDPGAQYLLGAMYFNGQGVEKNPILGMQWLKRASDQGSDQAQAIIDQIFDMAEQGGVEAQRLLGAVYREGVGFPQSYEESIQWYRRAANQGDADAQYNLGVIYWKGLGITQDRNQTMALWRQAAAQGHESAQRGLEKIESMKAR